MRLVLYILQPDRPDELERIEAAGGRVIYWDGPRVLGVLAMSRAIGKGCAR
jgi:protein phosphatase 2C